MSTRAWAGPSAGFGFWAIFPVALLVLLFYGWTVSPEGTAWRQWGRAEEYYNSEVDGFRSGHLWLALAAPPQLIALANPYDPVQNAPYRLHDASYFRGHYYLYFGVTPALTFFWPVVALSGHHASEVQGVLFFSAIGYGTSLALLAAVRRRYFPQVGPAALAACALALGVVNMLPTLLRRPTFYEVAIACAYAFAMLALGALWRALHGPRPIAWTALASLAYGLAVAARPDYAFGAAIVLLPVWQRGRNREGSSMPVRPLALGLAAVTPLAAVVAGLMIFNFERFGSALEFGEAYQLSGALEGTYAHFGFTYLPPNLWAYLLAPARLSVYFPYVTIIRGLSDAPSHWRMEDPFGVVPNLPFVLLACLVPLVVKGRTRLSAWLGAVGAMALLTAGVLCLFAGACSRYMVDFLPACALLATVTVMGLEAAPKFPWRWAVRVGWVAALGWSALFGILASIQHNDLLRLNHPGVYGPLARIGNLPSYGLDRLLGTRYGPLELTLTFPVGRVGKLEPLLVSGTDFKSDYLYLYYPDPHHVIFGVEHTGYGGPLTEPVAVDFRVPHRLLIDSAALYPPRNHPFFWHWTKLEIADHVRRVRLNLDGRWLMDDPVDSYDPVARSPQVGFSAESDAFGRKFTGVISAMRRVGPVAPEPFGAIRLYLEFPQGLSGTSEPLLSTGVTGRGDLIRILYVDPGHVRFIHDQWGYGGSASADIPVAYGGRHRIELSLGSLYPDGPWASALPAPALARVRQRVRVTLDGQLVLDVAESSHPADPSTVVVGANAIGASYAQPRYTGRILNQERVLSP